MAPLLGRKPYPLAKPLAEPPGPGEEVYTIERTKEAFRNKEEYEARLKRYDERIWTCKSTGSSQLTHKEAWEEEQEVTELLLEEYPKWFEKPVLEMVHHNTVSLDKLVEMAWMEILTKYAVDEECDFLVGKEKSLQVKVVKVHPLENPEGEMAEKKLEGACDSPSSDKENASQENQRKEPAPREEENRRESLSDRARRSPRKLSTATKEEKRKWVMPKFLPHKYDVKLINEDKVISDVPADSLYRTERPPTKEIIRYFIRHYALRLGMGESAPWVVEDGLVKKFSLPSKFSDFLLSPHKFLAEHPSSKRKSLTSPEGKRRKKLKSSDAPGEESANEKGEKKRRKKKDASGMPLSPTIWGHMQKIKMNGSPLKVKNSGSPKKDEVKGVDPSDEKSGRKSGDKKAGKSNILKASKNDGKDGAKTPKMKQMTLLHLTKSTPAGSPRKRARSTGMGTPKLGKPLHPMALHLLRYYNQHKDKEDRKSALSSLISKVVKTLSPDDWGRLPEDLRLLVQKRSDLLERKKQWAAMSQEEKEKEIKKKREKMRQKARERREREMLVRREQSRRYEDQEIEGGKNLPAFKLVDMPEGLPNTLFGNVAMVVDFLHCYAGLLMPDDQYPITAVALMEALAGERSGFLYLNRVLVVLLQTLLQDELAEGYGELDMPLSEIPLTMHSASELARLCLRSCDAHGGGSGQGSEAPGGLGGFDDVVTGEFLDKLETVEVFELSPEEKVYLLMGLCHRILMTYSVEDHVDAKLQRSAELWKERLAMLKGVNDRKRAERQRLKEMELKGEKKKEVGAKKESKKEVKVEPKVEPEPEDMISTVKSRRLMSMQAKKEKEETDRQNKERMEKEAEEERLRRQRAASERAFQDGISKARLVLRRTPLGTDRNHNRYWLFSDVVPGLYIEKGWVHESIDYSFTPPPEDKPAEPEVEGEEEEEEEDEEEEDDGGSAITNDSRGAEKDDGSMDGAVGEGAQQGAAADVCIETSVPKQGQNLWFVCDSTAELEELVESLHAQGVRESELKAKIQNRYQDVLHSIHLTRKAKLGLRTCDGYAELLKYLRSDIQEVASRLQKGGLGYLDDHVDIEDQMKDKESLKDFGECIITIQGCVIKKFLQGFMAPKQKKKKKVGAEESSSSKAEEVDEEKRLAEEARVATAVEKWKTAIGESQTFSRMHVLLGMLDACIKWDMSAENARCKVCRGKGDDEKLILCDECNKAFHLLCLRPALYRIPVGEWLCPACQPTVTRRGTRTRNYKQDSDEEDEEEESEEEESEDEEDDEEYNDYKAMGHTLRPRKKIKPLSSRPKSSKVKPKKTPSSGGQSGKQRTGPNCPADIDELVRQTSQSGVTKHALELERCEEILKKLTKFRFSWPFREPVSPDEAEDYLDIISQPMDFQTMLGKIGRGSYRHTQDFLEDVKLVFSNAEEYNQQGSAVLSCMVKTEQTFVELLQKLLPGLGYLRRRTRKRVSKAPATSEEEEEEEEPKKMQNGKSKRKKAGKGRRRKYAEIESEEEEEEEEEQEEEREEDNDTGRRRSKRNSATSVRKDYREQDSDGERDTKKTRQRRSRGPAGGGASSNEDRSSKQRHSKKQKHR
ncbi:tyrosine-protein kinase BAZ1B [Brachionichthys hirsutus]|uniref:tyrosine-protein kinase BAZ1B n=1 Tax=Brachionichthys hirsutus TaxID=412623 RepID=UPI0036048825